MRGNFFLVQSTARKELLIVEVMEAPAKKQKKASGHGDVATMDRQLKQLREKKAAAVEAEDYAAAKRLKGEIESLTSQIAQAEKAAATNGPDVAALEKRLSKLKAKKAAALESEDYDVAKKIKGEIDTLTAGIDTLTSAKKEVKAAPKQKAAPIIKESTTPATTKVESSGGETSDDDDSSDEDTDAQNQQPRKKKAPESSTKQALATPTKRARLQVAAAANRLTCDLCGKGPFNNAQQVYIGCVSVCIRCMSVSICCVSVRI